MLFRMRTDGQGIEDMVDLLVRAGRLYAARKIAQVKCSELFIKELFLRMK